MQILMGLNETYTVVCGHILLMNSIPTLGKAFSLLLQEERQHGIVSPQSLQDFATLAAKGNKSYMKIFKIKSFKQLQT